MFKGGAPRAKVFSKRMEANCSCWRGAVTEEESVLSDEVRRKTKEVMSLQAEKLRLQEKVCSLSTPSPGTSSRVSKRRSLEDLSVRQQRRRKRQRVSECEQVLGFLEKEGIIPTKIKCLNMVTCRTETVELNTDEAEAIFGPDPRMSQDDEDEINMMLFVKDRYNVSQDAYHEMAKICKEMPRHYLLKRRIAELNKLWNIKPTPHDTHGSD